MLKVTRLHREFRGSVRREEWVPFLRLSGHWLEQAGFHKYARVFVTAEQGRLVITTSDPALTAAQRQPIENSPDRMRRATVRLWLDVLRRSHSGIISRRRSLAHVRSAALLRFAALARVSVPD